MFDALGSIIEFLGEVLRLGGVFVLGVLAGGIVAAYVFGRRARDARGRQRVGRPIGADRTEAYRAAVEAASADGTLSAAARERLEEMEGRLGIGEAEAARIERGVMGVPKDEVEDPEKEGLRLYRVAVEVAGEGMSVAVKDRLDAMEREFGLSGEEAGGVEREVLGTLKEEAFSPEPIVNGSAQYHAAVRLAWADCRLNKDEERGLVALERSLALGDAEADSIEREVMGGLREKVVSEDVPDERWEGLVEECVELVEEFDRNMAGFDEPRRELADHAVWRIAEILERSGVDLISDDEAFDKKRHRPHGGKAAPSDPIAETISPGFTVGRRVLRKAKVRVE